MKPLKEIQKRFDDDQETQVFCVTITNKNNDESDEQSLSMGITLEDAEILCASFGRLISRFKNEKYHENNY